MKLKANISTPRGRALSDGYIAVKNKFVSDPGSLDLQELALLKNGTEREIAMGADGSWRTAGLVPTLNNRLQEIERAVGILSA